MTPEPDRGPGVIVVGTGFGARIHVPALRQAGFRVMALVGTDEARTSRRATRLGVPALTDLSDALDLPGVEAVTVATPPATHMRTVVAAVAAGKHVLCEKPFALDAGEARAMCDAARAAGVVGMIGNEFRFSPERALIARLITDGAVGAPRLAVLASATDLVANADASMPRWWFDPSQGGGWLAASGSHLVDQLRTWLGEVEWVSATLSVVSDRPRGSADDSFSVLFRTRSGADGVLQQSGGCHGAVVPVSRVSGPRGTVWLDGSEVWTADSLGARRVEIPGDLRIEPAAAVGDDPRHRFSHLELGPYTRLVSEWRAAMQGREAALPAPATFDDGLAAMEVLDAIRRSAASGERIQVQRSDG